MQRCHGSQGDLTPRSDPDNLEFLRAFIRNGYRLTDAQSHELDREGNERYFLNNFIGIVLDGQLRRAWGSQRDLTLSRQAESVIQASEARFRSVFESGMIGIAFWNGESMTEDSCPPAAAGGRAAFHRHRRHRLGGRGRH